MGETYREGKGIRDNLLGVSTVRPLLYNDEACQLVSVKGRAATVGGAKAVSVLTSDDTNFSDGDTVTIGAIVYRFKSTMAQAYDVKLHATVADTSLANLVAAINGTGTAGVEWFAGTVAHPYVTAGAVTSHATTITAKQGGVSANTLATTTTATHLSWADTTLGGGTGTSDPGDDLKFELGYVTAAGQTCASATSLMATSGELNISNLPDTDKSMTIKASPNDVMPKGSWLVVKTITGTVGALAGFCLSIKRRRLEGLY